MISGKLFKNLNLLDKQKLNDFEKFVNSPYFLKRSQLPVLLSEIRKYTPSYNITKERLFSGAFPGKPYNELLMRKYISELNGMFDEYLAVSSFKEDYWAYMNKLTQKNVELKNFDEAEKLASEAVAKLEKNSQRNEKYYYNKFLFESHLKTVSNKKVNLNPDTDWRLAMDGFVNYTALTVLQFYFIILNDSKFRKDKFSINFGVLNEMVKVLKKNVIAENPVAGILYNLVKSYLEPENETYYFSIKSLLLKHHGLMADEEVAHIYTYLHNYCFIKVDSGNLNFLAERFDIVNQVLAKGFHLQDGYIIPDMFISMAMNAMMFKRNDWAEEFINNYKGFLPSDQRHSIENFTYSALYMFNKDYDKAIEYLSKVKFTKYYDKFKIKSLNLMIFYEAELFESSFSHADAFKHFISKYKSITPYVRERTNNFIKQVLQLIKYRLNEAGSPETKEFGTKAIMYRPWLIQKIEEAKILRNQKH